jgi:hypothetical protein
MRFEKPEDLDLGLLFNATQKGPWQKAGEDCDYRVIPNWLPGVHVLSFKGTDSDIDWKDNFAFFPRAYKRMPVPWRAHGGFLRAWKAASDQIMLDVLEVLEIFPGQVVVTGYSHGGAIAHFAYEDLFYLGHDVLGVVFGSPRVLWLPRKSIRARFARFLRVATYGDIVARVAPVCFGFVHVGGKKRIGPRALLSHLPHYAERYREELGG